MTTATPLMPKATAVWLVANTSLSFDQIADFCHLHPLEVQAIADGEAAQSIKGLDPVLTGQLTREDIEKAEGDPELPPRRAGAARARARRQAQGTALHAGVAPPGPPERDPLAAPQSSRAEGRGDHAPRRHHQADDRIDPQPLALELEQPAADRPGRARPLLADRPRLRSREGSETRAATARRARGRNAAAGVGGRRRSLPPRPLPLPPAARSAASSARPPTRRAPSSPS